VRIDIPVAWGDMDALGHVNNVVYIRWLESGRVAYLARLGQAAFLEGSAIGPILASIQCRFKAPVVFPDTVVVATRASEIGADRITFSHRIFSRTLGRVVAEGEGVMVSYDYTQGRRAPLPAAVRSRIE
jgi:acyl-CoA thioester hydrolase